MAFTYAGQYTEVILGTSPAGFAVALPSLPVNVYTVGTSTPVTLYTSRTKGATTGNPVSTDVIGNLTVFTNPGQYDLVFTPPGGSTKRVTVTVPIDPAEPAATYMNFTAMAAEPDLLLSGSITRDSNGAATAGTLTWPDGATGAYTATTVSSSFPGAVDAYTLTRVVSGVTTTYTQSAVTRDATTGAVTNRPAITVV